MTNIATLSRMIAKAGAISVVLAALMSLPAVAQTFPAQTVRIVVPYSAGGSPDVIIRVVAQELSLKWGHPVIIDNKPGGNTIIGVTDVVKSPADGHTLLFTTDGTFLLNPIYYKSLPYSMKDLTPVSLLATAPHVLVASKSVPVTNVKEFVEWVKKNPGKAKYGATGSMSLQKLAMERFARLSGIKILAIPYKGAPETTTALLGGEISASINGVALLTPYIASGAIRGLAITADKRSPIAPDLPTATEQGLPDFRSQGMFGLFAPAHLPDAVREKIQKDIVAVLEQPSIKSLLEARGFDLRGDDGVKFAALIASESGRWKGVMDDLGVKQQ